jgi:hypothetical protein
MCRPLAWLLPMLLIQCVEGAGQEAWRVCASASGNGEAPRSGRTMAPPIQADLPREMSPKAECPRREERERACPSAASVARDLAPRHVCAPTFRAARLCRGCTAAARAHEAGAGTLCPSSRAVGSSAGAPGRFSAAAGAHSPAALDAARGRRCAPPALASHARAQPSHAAAKSKMVRVVALPCRRDAARPWGSVRAAPAPRSHPPPICQHSCASLGTCKWQSTQTQQSSGVGVADAAIEAYQGACDLASGVWCPRPRVGRLPLRCLPPRLSPAAADPDPGGCV